MPYIQVDETKYPLSRGDVTVGGGPDARIRLGGGDDAGPGIQAVIQIGADGNATIRRHSPTAVVRVNGVQLGGEPTPLIHGDKIGVSGRELLFGDDRRGGSTLSMSGMQMPQSLDSPAGGPATAATGGRLVSLVDGREYMVGAEPLVIGRDASCDVVVPGGEVSRRHAEIGPGLGGYVLRDMSANGVRVNGERVMQAQRLGKGDIVQIGNEEFRFHADVAAPAGDLAPVPASGDGPGGSAAVASDRMPASHTPSSRTDASSTASSSTAASGAIAPSHVAPSARMAASRSDSGQAAAPPPAAPARPRGPVLAELEIVNAGMLRGTRFELTTPLVHIGRGAHNEVSIDDESVSDSHAKLQKREGAWYIVDIESTNGTYVAGARVRGEQRLEGAPDLRFGGVKLKFSPAAPGPDTAKGTKVIAGSSARQARQLAARAPSMGPPPPPPGSSPEASGRLPLWFWLAAAALLAAAIIFFMQGRS